MTEFGFAAAPVPAGPPAPDDLACVAAGRTAVLAPDGQHGWRLPALAEVPDACVVEPMGAIDGRPVWLATMGRTSTPDGLAEVPWLDLVSVAPAAVTSVAARAIQTTNWRAAHRFCGACGQEADDLSGRSALRCGACGHFEHIKAQPVALVGIWRRGPSGGAQVLLARHTYGVTTLWALTGGYLEAAESLEEAAVREAAEEVGLAVTDLRYYGSAGWGNAGPSVMLAVFLGRAQDPTAEPVVDGREIAEARYFPIEALPANIPPQPLIVARLLADLPALL